VRLAVVVGLALASGVASAGPLEIHDPMTHAVSRFTTGRVTQADGMLEVTLSDRDPGCGPPSASPQDPRLVFYVPAGPGGTFYAGGKAGVMVIIAGTGTGSVLGPESNTLALSAIKLDAGTHLTGTLDMLYGSGSFDAIVCPGIDAKKLHALPASAPTTPFAGKIQGTAFQVKSAIARIERQSDTFSLVRSVRLYAVAGVTCQTADTAVGTVVNLSDIGGASTTAQLTGSPQPATAGVTGQHGYYERDHVWVQLDKLAFTAGASIPGRAVIDADGTSLAGAFTAIACGP